MTKLSGEMVNNGILLEAEVDRLAAEELGYDMEKLASLAKLKRSDAFTNLSLVFAKELKTMNIDPWNVEIQR